MTHYYIILYCMERVCSLFTHVYISILYTIQLLLTSKIIVPVQVFIEQQCYSISIFASDLIGILFTSPSRTIYQ
jgi:hypothetical protein